MDTADGKSARMVRKGSLCIDKSRRSQTLPTKRTYDYDYDYDSFALIEFFLQFGKAVP